MQVRKNSKTFCNQQVSRVTKLFLIFFPVSILSVSLTGVFVSNRFWDTIQWEFFNKQKELDRAEREEHRWTCGRKGIDIK